MIKIRYADLPGGLHVRAVARGRDTVIYLVPGLTVDQRRAALRRARSSARMGHGPPLSATGVTCAMVADRIRTTVGNAAAAMRVHPAMFVPITVVILSATVAYFLLMSVTIKVRPPQAGWRTRRSSLRSPRPPGRPGAANRRIPASPVAPADRRRAVRRRAFPRYRRRGRPAAGAPRRVRSRPRPPARRRPAGGSRPDRRPRPPRHPRRRPRLRRPRPDPGCASTSARWACACRYRQHRPLGAVAPAPGRNIRCRAMVRRSTVRGAQDPLKTAAPPRASMLGAGQRGRDALTGHGHGADRREGQR